MLIFALVFTSAAAAQDAPDAGISALSEDARAALEKRGKRLFLRCRSCHSLKQAERHRTGPNLNGLIGADAGAKDTYQYSDAVKASGIVWNEGTLDAWLLSPAALIPGNRMVFAGLRKPQDRQALIAYLIASTAE
ncbi:MAG: c-type cytochrome [Pseudomonadota bacterium]